MPCVVPARIAAGAGVLAPDGAQADAVAEAAAAKLALARGG